MNNNRTVVMVVVLIASAALCALSFTLPSIGWGVAFPVTEVAPETIVYTDLKFLGFPLYVKNTLVSFIITFVLVLALALPAGAVARRKLAEYKSNPKAVDADGNDVMVPKAGWYNTFEAVVEFMFNLTEDIIGSKWAASAFPLVFTIFFFTLVANWLHFLPLTDTVGIVHCSARKEGYPVESIVGDSFYRLDVRQIFGRGAAYGARDCEYDIEHGYIEEAPEDVERVDELRYVITPFVRTLTTDLNYTFSLAIIAMVAVQIYGFRELGPAYLSKFFNFPALARGPIGLIEFAVGFIELIGEFLKVLSFALRLFGNLFAGTVLLFAMVFLVAFAVPLPFFFLEVLIGALQAVVFAMLTIVFIAVAQVGHGHHDEDEHH
ncbi:MAG: F0F1 ATP synthase subunit A [Chloroflexi bacterium]|nr:F0F1 ATP synthase subunit A [Chloroflexota bacterium]